MLSFIFLVTEYPVAKVMIRDTRKMTMAVGSQQFLQESNFL